MAPMNPRKDCRLLQWKRNLWLLFKLLFGHELLKGLSCSYDAEKRLAHFIWWWIDSYLWNLGRPDFCRSYEPTRIIKEEPKERFEQGKARRDDPREE